MRRLSIAVGVVVSLLLAFGSIASAGGPVPFGPTIGPLDPFQFGLGALATWARDAGKPSLDLWDPDQYGLYLQKGTATTSYAAAGADIKVKNLPATKLTVLSFDISGVSGVGFDDFGGTSHGYCGAGAPRFNVVSTAGTCFLGCTYGSKTQDPATGWWTINFASPFTQYPGCDLVGVSGTVTGISIILDEGIDIGPGNVVLDNIRVNNTVFKKP